MSRLSCTKIKLLAQKSVFKVLLFQNVFISADLREAQNLTDSGKLSTLIKLQLFQFLLSFCLHPQIRINRKIFPKYMDPDTSTGWELLLPLQALMSLVFSFVLSFVPKIKGVLRHQLQVIRCYAALQYPISLSIFGIDDHGL